MITGRGESSNRDRDDQAKETMMKRNYQGNVFRQWQLISVERRSFTVMQISISPVSLNLASRHLPHAKLSSCAKGVRLREYARYISLLRPNSTLSRRSLGFYELLNST